MKEDTQWERQFKRSLASAMQSHILLFSFLEELRNRERSHMENQNAEFDHLEVSLVLVLGSGLKNT